MSSGVYAVLTGAVGKMQTLDVVANNLSNINTAGFKKERINFSSLLDDATQTGRAQGLNYTYIPETKTDYTQGMMQTTQNDYDVAINGDGFFKVQRGEDILYTRLGNFKRATDGTLVTRSGEQVLSADSKTINVPEGPIGIDDRGVILSNAGEVGQIGVFDPDVNLLKKQGGSQFVYGGDEQAVPASAEAQLFQRRLEQSNVGSMQETTIMMTSMRAFESYQKAMKNYFTIESKADEIGSL
ncbi:MAG: flagellar hook basal-body protein [Desulfuromonas sp.]|nr:flagellar hook basal-body protein [Desulfuromonas sp.]